MISLLVSKPLTLSMAKAAAARLAHQSHVQPHSSAAPEPYSLKRPPTHCSAQHKTLGQQPRFNPLGIEMLPDRLYRQVFGVDPSPDSSGPDLQGFAAPLDAPQSSHNLQRCIQHLKRHDLLPKQLSEIDTIYEYHKHLSSMRNSESQQLASQQARQRHQSAQAIDNEASRGEFEQCATARTAAKSNRTEAALDDQVVMDIPRLEGQNIDEHFHNLGKRYSAGYRAKALALIELGPRIAQHMPTNWVNEAGWTRYEPDQEGGFRVSSVEAPLEDTVVFDVETCMHDTVEHTPTLAVAMSTEAWYSWTSPRLVNKLDLLPDQASLTAADLIPFNSSKIDERLIVGHNVGFDRSFIQDQYAIEQNQTKFLDTLSLHMCICGLTGLQRAVKVAHKRKLKDNEPIEADELNSSAWVEKGSLNNLADVYEFHCNKKINKDDREIFVEGSMDDVRQNFQSLMTYCAHDVRATFEVFQTLFATFSERFPHPVTLAGMLEMSTMYLPVNTDNWRRYIDASQAVYDQYEQQLSSALQELAKEACSMSEEEYARDVWLWDVDRSKQSIKANKAKLAAWQKQRAARDSSEQSLEQQVQDIYDSRQVLRQVAPFMAGFPKWYRELCCPAAKADTQLAGKPWQPGPCLISSQMRITPKLMRLTWNGYPVHHSQKHGWGYLVPNGDLLAQYVAPPDDHPYAAFPLESLRLLCRDLPHSQILVDEGLASLSEADEAAAVQAKIEQLKDNTQLGTLHLIKLLKRLSRKKKVAPRYKNEFCEDVDIPGAYFIKIPHKQGPGFNVGNPLSKDFIAKMEDGTLSSSDNQFAKLLLGHSLSLSYWKNNHKRIKGQMVVSLGAGGSPLGAILPRVIVAGTVTRRAVEPTWLTASNQDSTRIGSELKAMVQAPAGYSFVGADVDSQELWIASLMGDSYSYKIHGGTGLSYMTLRGSKSDKTDMHSKTASLIGISRSDAKVLNYARIYGAGQKFIERFLLNTNQQLKPEEARLKAKTIFKETKGVRQFRLLEGSIGPSTPGDKQRIAIPIPASHSTATHSDPQAEMASLTTDYNYESEAPRGRKRGVRVFWHGGTESATFNKLEEIASSARPRTPVLQCQISQALEPEQDQAQDFVTSRVNWVVQSSAVDFLHLALVNMRWLFEQLQIEGRFAISIHDEVRYLVRDQDRYKAAFALQVSNLLVRAYFAYKLNMRDLPISVAFFSSVDIDRCLRKEVDMDCRSPSNPAGLSEAFDIPAGESLDVNQTLKRFTYKA